MFFVAFGNGRPKNGAGQFIGADRRFYAPIGGCVSVSYCGLNFLGHSVLFS